MNQKTALVISGGGSKGAFAVGALKHIIEDLGVDFQIVAGTSTGALITPFIVANEFRRVRRLYLTTVTKDFVTPRSEPDDVAMGREDPDDEDKERGLMEVVKGAESIFDTKPLENIIDDEMGESFYEKIVEAGNRGVQMFLTTVCLQTGNVVFFQTGPTAKVPDFTVVEPITSHEQMKKAALASANMPVLMPPVRIKTASGNFQYIDGGVREYAPLRAAVDNGADTIYAIYLSPKKDSPFAGEFHEAFPTQKSQHEKNRKSILERVLDLFSGDVKENDIRILERYNETIRFHQALKTRLMTDLSLTDEEAERLFENAHADSMNPYHQKREITLHEIYPERGLDVDTLHVDPIKMVEMHDIGYARAKKILG